MIAEFIKNTINEIFLAFPKIKECIYSFDKYSNTHFIKIDSLQIYNSEEFAELDAEVSVKFYNLGIDGSLCILSPESQIELANSESFLNSKVLEESNISEGIIYYNTVDLFYFHAVTNNVLLNYFFDESFNPDNSITYSLAA